MVQVDIVKRFESKIMPEPNTGCWLWTGCLFDSGYGVFRSKGKNLRAHRISYSLYNGTIPLHALVCHKCDTRSCVNPLHLFLGTGKDNTQDMIRKGRKPSQAGENHSQARLKNEDIILIRSRIMSPVELSKKYGISVKYIYEIQAKRKWKQVNHGANSQKK